MLKINNENRFYYLVMFFAFILPLSRAAISFFVILLPILWVMEGNFKEKYHQIIRSKLLVAILLYLAFNLISILWSSNFYESLKVIRYSAYWFTLFVIATKIKKEQVNSIISAFLMGMFLSEIIAYGVFFELWNFKDATVENPSPFMFWIDYSVYMAFTSILLLNRILSKNYSLKQKIIFSFFFLTVTGNLFLAIGRTGQVAFIVAMFVLMIVHFRFTLKSLFLSIGMLSIIFFSAYNLSDSFKVRSEAGLSDIKNISNMNLNGSWGIRIAYWIVSYNIVKDEPILGVGVGDYSDEIRKELAQNNYNYLSNETKAFMGSFHPHNQYLMVALQMGLVGLLLLLYIIYQIIILKIEDREIKELSLLFTTIFFVSCFAEPLFYKQFTLVLFLFFIGLFAVADESHSKF